MAAEATAPIEANARAFVAMPRPPTLADGDAGREKKKRRSWPKRRLSANRKKRYIAIRRASQTPCFCRVVSTRRCARAGLVVAQIPSDFKRGALKCALWGMVHRTGGPSLNATGAGERTCGSVGEAVERGDDVRDVHAVRVLTLGPVEDGKHVVAAASAGGVGRRGGSAAAAAAYALVRGRGGGRRRRGGGAPLCAL